MKNIIMLLLTLLFFTSCKIDGENYTQPFVYINEAVKPIDTINYSHFELILNANDSVKVFYTKDRRFTYVFEFKGTHLIKDSLNVKNHIVKLYMQGDDGVIMNIQFKSDLLQHTINCINSANYLTFFYDPKLM